MTEQTAAIGAKSVAHGQLPFARCTAREEQVRNIDEGDHEEQRDGAAQHRQRVAERQGILWTPHADAPPDVAIPRSIEGRSLEQCRRLGARFVA